MNNDKKNHSIQRSFHEKLHHVLPLPIFVPSSATQHLAMIKPRMMLAGTGDRATTGIRTSQREPKRQGTSWISFRLRGRASEDNNNVGNESTYRSRIAPIVPNALLTSLYNQTEKQPEIARTVRLTSQLVLLPPPLTHTLMSTATATTSDEMADNLESHESFHQRFSMSGLVRRHGILVWNTYWGIYFGTLAIVFGSIQSRLLDPVRLLSSSFETTANPSTTNAAAAQFLQRRFASSPFLSHTVASRIQSTPPWVANVVVAWIVTELCEPLRVGATCVTVPTILWWRGQEQGQQEPEE